MNRDEHAGQHDYRNLDRGSVPASPTPAEIAAGEQRGRARDHQEQVRRGEALESARAEQDTRAVGEPGDADQRRDQASEGAGSDLSSYQLNGQNYLRDADGDPIAARKTLTELKPIAAEHQVTPQAFNALAEATYGLLGSIPQHAEYTLNELRAFAHRGLAGVMQQHGISPEALDELFDGMARIARFRNGGGRPSSSAGPQRGDAELYKRLTVAFNDARQANDDEKAQRLFEQRAALSKKLHGTGPGDRI